MVGDSKSTCARAEGTFEVWNGLGHGGEGETSMMLRVDPTLVDMSKAQGIIPKLPAYIDWKWLFKEITPYGVTGDPTKATTKKGNLMNDARALGDMIEIISLLALGLFLKNQQHSECYRCS